MKPNDLIMYIADDEVFLWKESLIREKAKRNIINNGKVAKPQEFLKFLETILKKNKLNKGIINNNIIVLVDPNYTQADTEVINNILDQLSFNKIRFINILSLLDISKNKIWIIANKKYMYLIHYNYKNKIEAIFIDLKLFKNNINMLIRHLLIFIKRKQTIIIGIYDNLEMLATKIEKESKSNIYFIDDTITYFIDKIKIH